MYEPRRPDYRHFELLIEALKDVESTDCINLFKQYFLINVIGLEELILWTLQILTNTELLLSGRCHIQLHCLFIVFWAEKISGPFEPHLVKPIA